MSLFNIEQMAGLPGNGVHALPGMGVHALSGIGAQGLAGRAAGVCFAFCSPRLTNRARQSGKRIELVPDPLICAQQISPVRMQTTCAIFALLFAPQGSKVRLLPSLRIVEELNN